MCTYIHTCMHMYCYCVLVACMRIDIYVFCYSASCRAYLINSALAGTPTL